MYAIRAYMYTSDFGLFIYGDFYPLTFSFPFQRLQLHAMQFHI